MGLHEVLTFDTPRGEVDVLRVADGWIYHFVGTGVSVHVRYSAWVGRAEGAERFIR
jgi:hypothetical protein